jgi:hypothetical protein
MVGHIKKLHIKINKLTIEITSFSLYGTRTLQPIWPYNVNAIGFILMDAWPKF